MTQNGRKALLFGFWILLLVLAAVPALRVQNPEIRFLDPGDRGIVEVRPAGDGFYTCRAKVQVDGPLCQTIVLEADGLKMSEATNGDKEPSWKAELAWWPWHGNGTYRLKAYAQRLHTQEFQASAEIRVEVAGIARDAVTPENRLIKMLRESSGYAELFAAPTTRFTSPNPGESCWVSAIWAGSSMYRAYLYDDGREEVQKWPVNIDPGDLSARNQPLTRPAGTYRLLVVMLDYGTLTIDRAKAMADLAKAAEDANRTWAETARQTGKSEPFFKLRVTGAYAKTVPNPGLLIAPLATIKSLTGINPGDFDLYAQVDLSADPPAALRSPAGGLCFSGYKGHPTDQTNLWILVRSPESLYGDLRWTLLDHELAHSCGWQHEWPVGLGGGPENTSFRSVWPTLLFGWTDRDGDGKIEILSANPYGIR